MEKPKLLTREQVEMLATQKLHDIQVAKPEHLLEIEHRAAATIEALAADLRWALMFVPNQPYYFSDRKYLDEVRARWQSTGFLEQP